MDEEVVGCLYYIGKDQKMGNVISQTPYKGYDGFIEKVKSVRNSDGFVEFKPSLGEQIDRNF